MKPTDAPIEFVATVQDTGERRRRLAMVFAALAELAEQKNPPADDAADGTETTNGGRPEGGSNAS